MDHAGECGPEGEGQLWEEDYGTGNTPGWWQGTLHPVVTSVCVDSPQLLITSNDSRLRLYHLSDYSLVCTYKGLTNNSYQIRASFRCVRSCVCRQISDLYSVTMASSSLADRRTTLRTYGTPNRNKTPGRLTSTRSAPLGRTGATYALAHHARTNLCWPLTIP